MDGDETGGPGAHRYNSAAILLHWLMAIGFLLMFASGLAMTYLELDQAFQFQLYQWHKSGGVLLLLAFILRIAWRVVSHRRRQIPRLPDGMAGWERRAAKAGHWGLYAMSQ